MCVYKSVCSVSNLPIILSAAEFPPVVTNVGLMSAEMWRRDDMTFVLTAFPGS